MPHSIQAEVHPDAINHISSFFDGTLTDIFNEMLQNARRAGATQVEITATDETPHVITIADDGDGIANPQAILSFGHSQWSDTATSREHPAGMGFYSLARCQQVQVTSWPRHGQPWQVTLDERATSRPASQLSSNPSNPSNRRSIRPSRHGAAITITLPPNQIRREPYPAGIRNQAATAAQHLSIPVRFNGDRLEQRDFLSKAAAVYLWQGIRIGVYPHNRYQPSANFHGITVQYANLPQVKSVHNTWSVAIDIVDCDQLTLTLPARKEFVETPFLAQLRDQCRRAIYQSMRDLEDNPAVPYQVQQDAASLGVTLPDPPALLPPWEPADANYTQRQPRRPYQWPTLPDRAIIVEANCEAPDQQILARAADQNDLLPRLVQAQPIFEGYSWYDRLPRLTGFNFTVTDPDKTTILEHDREEATTPAPVRQPDAITCQLTLRHPGRSDQSEPERLALSTDVVFLADLDCEYEPTPARSGTPWRKNPPGNQRGAAAHQPGGPPKDNPGRKTAGQGRGKSHHRPPPS